MGQSDEGHMAPGKSDREGISVLQSAGDVSG